MLKFIYIYIYIDIFKTRKRESADSFGQKLVENWCMLSSKLHLNLNNLTSQRFFTLLLNVFLDKFYFQIKKKYLFEFEWNSIFEPDIK